MVETKTNHFRKHVPAGKSSVELDPLTKPKDETGTSLHIVSSNLSSISHGFPEKIN